MPRLNIFAHAIYYGTGARAYATIAHVITLRYIDVTLIVRFSHSNLKIGVFMGYSRSIRGVFTGYSYVSVMCRLCIGYVSVMYRTDSELGGENEKMIKTEKGLHYSWNGILKNVTF